MEISVFINCQYLQFVCFSSIEGVAFYFLKSIVKEIPEKSKREKKDKTQMMT